MVIINGTTGIDTIQDGTITNTEVAGTNNTQLATTAFVTTADNLKAPLDSPVFTGSITAQSAVLNNLGSRYNTLEFSPNGIRKSYLTLDSITSKLSLVNEVNADIELYTTANVVFGNHSHNSNGYQKLNNGLIIQWGTSLISVGGLGIVFPITFPNNIFGVYGFPEYPTNPSNVYISTNWMSTGGFGAIVSAGTLNYHWFAIGK